MGNLHLSRHERGRDGRNQEPAHNKTWSELHKWHHLCLFRDWFEVAAESIFSTQPGHKYTWRIDAIPWNENNTDAFQGLHNQGKRILVLFDEASVIAQKIYEVTKGALTDKDTQIIWCIFETQRAQTGPFSMLSTRAATAGSRTTLTAAQ